MATRKRRKQPTVLTRRAAAALRRTIKTRRADILELRRYFSGFDAKAGYSLRPNKLAKLSAARLKKLKVRARELHREKSQPYKVVRPRSVKSRRALYAHTRAEKVRGRKAFLVHVPKPDTTRIEIVGKKKKRVREVRRVKGARVVEQYFYFADYSKREPKTMAAIERVTRTMLKDMPRGRYVFMSGVYGDIGTSMDRDDLLDELQQRWMIYDAPPDPFAGIRESRGLAATLVGFRFVSTTEEGAARKYAQRLSRRLRYRMAGKRGRR